MDTVSFAVNVETACDSRYCLSSGGSMFSVAIEDTPAKIPVTQESVKNMRNCFLFNFICPTPPVSSGPNECQICTAFT